MCACVCVACAYSLNAFAVLCMYCLCMCVLFCFYCFCVCVCVSPPTHSCRKRSSWRESVTGSTPRLPSTPSQTPPSSRLTSTRRPRAARRPTGPSPLQLPASPSHPPRPPPRHPPRRTAAGLCLGSRRGRGSKRSRESRGPSTRAQIQKMVLISAWLKMNRLRQIKPLQQHRVRLRTGIYFIVLYFNILYNEFKNVSLIMTPSIFCPNILF